MDNIEKDEERIKNYYINNYGGNVSNMREWFSDGWFDSCYRFLGPYGVQNISEEFHRKYCGFYDGEHWKIVFHFRNRHTEQFYEDFFDKIPGTELFLLIREGVFSPEWIDRNSYRIPQEVWEWVYRS
jgi:hypothetical protein